MATFKKATRNTTAGSPGVHEEHAERLSKTLSESAQQIWLAGVGAFGRAQAEGAKLFESLVREGLDLEHNTRRFAGTRADVMRGAVESTVSQARGRATETWERLERAFEDRLQRTLVKLDVPGREELAELSRRVNALTAELRRHNATPAKPKAAAARGTARTARPPAKTAAGKPRGQRTARKAGTP